MIKALFFDLDGTISDTDAVHLANWLELLRPHGIDVDMNLYKGYLSSGSSREIIEELLPGLSQEQKNELVEREASGYRNRLTQTGPITGLRAFLEEARDRGLSVVLVSNATKEDARNSLEGLGLKGTFEPTIFAEDVGVEKPAPDPYVAALEELGISPEEALAFEDSPSGIGGAVEAGIPVVGLSSTHGPNELREAGAEFVVGDFADQALYDKLEG
ncbi:MAG: HAD family hydrolase [Rubrobacteraceae bacterium]